MRKATTVALFLALALPVSATAAPIAAPPGNSEADQYFETLPAPSGGRSPDSTKTVQDAVREGKLGTATERALQGRGETGQAVANIVAKTAPPRKGENAGGGSGGAGFALAAANAPEKQGLGALFPLILVATAVAAGASAVARRRTSAK